MRWFFQKTGWQVSDPWMTWIVDLDPTRRSGIIELATSRSGACVEARTAIQRREFRDGVAVVAIDPSHRMHRDPPGSPEGQDRPRPPPPGDPGEQDAHRRPRASPT